ncbi:hypothetical protein EZH22_10755 [Xanthobacter dioxanivorans]|uniref:Immunity MXAN-0049 protein domain-containing protein n=1 Tax=Xanthobacter dioxanivorans TaxID=2528964 RepID=A0A974PS19_9HYPH|nr:DUF1629 domain-containing protein [Xanthobacter dioxanivorans]QRG08714.1 hypothetical protein EZH22_10755 [Xanthobacter dioxanivorans]
MESAYLVQLPFNEEQYIAPNFSGGGEQIKRDLEVNGRLWRGMTLDGCLQFRIWAPDELAASAPSTITTKRAARPLPDFGIGPWGGFKLVSGDFVEIVNSLDPDKHQFIRIKNVIDQNGKSINKSYYIMNIVITARALFFDRSNITIRDTKLDNTIDGSTSILRTVKIGNPFKLTFHKNMIPQSNIWHGTIDDVNELFFSEALIARVRQAGLSPLNIRSVKIL